MYISRKLISRITGPVLFVLIYYIIPIQGLSIEGKAILASTAWIGFWWITEAMPIEATALLPMVLFPLTGALDMKSTTFPYANPLIFLFLGGFMIAITIEKWELHRRIALNIIAYLGTNPRKVILGFMLATGFLSMWISNTASTLMMMPIGISVIMNLDADKNFSKALMLSIAYAASIGGISTLVGTPPNIVFAGIVRDTFQVDIGFLDWMMIGLPFASLLIYFTWVYLTRFGFPISNQNTGQQSGIQDKLSALGKMTKEEQRVMIVFISTAVLWITRKYFIQPFLPGINDTVIAVVGGLSLFLIPDTQGNRLLNWQMMKNVPWGILILFGGGLSIANGFTETDLAQWIGGKLSLFANVHLFVLILVITASINFMTEITSNIATASMALPILAALAVSINIHPYYLMVGAIMAASCAFMLPVATAPNAIVFSSGHIRMRDMVKTGVWLNIVSILLITVFVYFILPLIWDLDIGLFIRR